MGTTGWPQFRADAGVPYVQALAPGAGVGAISGVDLSTEHHCDFWFTVDP